MTPVCCALASICNLWFLHWTVGDQYLSLHVHMGIITSSIWLWCTGLWPYSPAMFLSPSFPSLVFLPFPKDGYFLYMKSKCPAERGGPVPFPAALTPHHHCHWILPSLLILKQFFLAMVSPEEKLCAPRGEASRRRFSHSCVSLMPQTFCPQQTPKKCSGSILGATHDFFQSIHSRFSVNLKPPQPRIVPG